ncbi:MAG: hypothetical protein CMB99_08240 [Flavobacteriaceae bacterium]|nr:hypothetical protein [Flavobacteriaceae bacterium]|tara:strand:+ start:103716 stop:104156 length:441 start_codon:yes stop_codon:yes gene_type:complete
MFSKAESAQLRQEFWTSFGKSFPRKWILYNTKIKGLSFKFYADNKKAMIVLDIEHRDEIISEILFEQLESLKSILENEYLPEIIFNKEYFLENGKKISRIYLNHTEKFSIHNKNTWRSCYEFFNENMTKFEMFFLEFEDYIRQALS